MPNNAPLDSLATWLPAPALGGIAFAYAPRVTAARPPSWLSTFFSTSAAIMGAFFIALALLSVASHLSAYTISKVAGRGTFIYLAIGVAAAACGTVQTWPYPAYRYLFAITVGTGATATITLTRIGITNLFSAVGADMGKAAEQLAKQGAGGRSVGQTAPQVGQTAPQGSAAPSGEGGVDRVTRAAD